MNRRITAEVLVLSFTLLLLTAGVPERKAGRWNGWITDEGCGVKGAKAEHRDCAAKCVEKGARLVLYADEDRRLYRLDKQDLAREHLGHPVTVTGKATGNAIAVDSIDVLRAAA